MKKRKTLVRLAIVALVAEFVLLAVGLMPTNINNIEIRKAHARYIHDPSDATEREYKETIRRVLGTQHFIQNCALGLAVINLPVIWVCFRKLKSS